MKKIFFTWALALLFVGSGYAQCLDTVNNVSFSNTGFGATTSNFRISNRANGYDEDMATFATFRVGDQSTVVLYFAATPVVPAGSNLYIKVDSTMGLTVSVKNAMGMNASGPAGQIITNSMGTFFWFQPTEPVAEVHIDGNGITTRLIYEIYIGISVPPMTITQSNAGLCQGSCDTITASGATTYTWATLPGLTASGNQAIYCTTAATDTGAVKVQVVGTTTLPGCSISDTQQVDLRVILTPKADFSYTNSGLNYSFTDHTTDTVAPGASTYSCSWNFGDGSPVSSVKNPTHTFAAGTWTVTLTATNANGCSDVITKTITASGGTSIKGLATLGNITLSPNPATTGINLTGVGKAKVMLFDYTGKTIYNQDFNNGDQRIFLDVQGIANGMYLLKVTTDKGAATEKVVIAQ